MNELINDINFDKDFEVGMVMSPTQLFHTQAVIIHSNNETKVALMNEVKSSLKLKKRIREMIEESPLELNALKDLLKECEIA